MAPRVRAVITITRVRADRQVSSQWCIGDVRALNLKLHEYKLPFIATKIVIITSVNACDYSAVNSSRERQFQIPIPSDNLRARKEVAQKTGKRRAAPTGRGDAIARGEDNKYSAGF